MYHIVTISVLRVVSTELCIVIRKHSLYRVVQTRVMSIKRVEPAWDDMDDILGMDGEDVHSSLEQPPRKRSTQSGSARLGDVRVPINARCPPIHKKVYEHSKRPSDYTHGPIVPMSFTSKYSGCGGELKERKHRMDMSTLTVHNSAECTRVVWGNGARSESLVEVFPESSQDVIGVIGSFPFTIQSVRMKIGTVNPRQDGYGKKEDLLWAKIDRCDMTIDSISKNIVYSEKCSKRMEQTLTKTIYDTLKEAGVDATCGNSVFDCERVIQMQVSESRRESTALPRSTRDLINLLDQPWARTWAILLRRNLYNWGTMHLQNTTVFDMSPSQLEGYQRLYYSNPYILGWSTLIREHIGDAPTLPLSKIVRQTQNLKRAGTLSKQSEWVLEALPEHGAVMEDMWAELWHIIRSHGHEYATLKFQNDGSTLRLRQDFDLYGGPVNEGRMKHVASLMERIGLVHWNEEEEILYPAEHRNAYEAINDAIDQRPPASEAFKKYLTLFYREGIPGFFSRLVLNQLNAQQREALEAMASPTQSFMVCMTGGPGTGKTHTIRAMEKALGKHLKIRNVAATGAAASHLENGTTVERFMREMIRDSNISTHKYEPYRPLLFGLWGSIQSSYCPYSEESRVPVDIVFCDETSMIDLATFAALLFVLRTTTTCQRLILCGDVNQLPPPGPGNVFRTVIETHKTAELTQNVRLDRGSNDLFSMAQSVMAGCPEEDPIPADSPSVTHLQPDDSMSLVDSLHGHLTTNGWAGSTYTSGLDIVLAFTNDTVNTCNRMFLQKYHPELRHTPQDFRKMFRKKDCEWIRPGVRVMCTLNREASRGGSDVYNGLTGTIEDLSVYKFVYDPKLVDTEDERPGWSRYKVGALQDATQRVAKGDHLFVRAKEGWCLELDYHARRAVRPAYAITGHKSQGSEYRTVYVLLEKGIFKELLYTMITRAKNNVVLVGSKRAFVDASRRVAKPRKTLLGKILGQ